MNFSEQVQVAVVLASQETDFTIRDVKRICRVPKGRYEDNHALAIMRMVKQVAPFDLWTVHERRGWYSRATTYEVRQVAFYVPSMASATRIQLQTEILQRHRRGDKMTGLALGASRMVIGAKELFESDLPARDRDDSTLSRIDRLIAAGKGQ